MNTICADHKFKRIDNSRIHPQQATFLRDTLEFQISSRVQGLCCFISGWPHFPLYVLSSVCTGVWPGPGLWSKALGFISGLGWGILFLFVWEGTGQALLPPRKLSPRAIPDAPQGTLE